MENQKGVGVDIGWFQRLRRLSRGANPVEQNGGAEQRGGVESSVASVADVALLGNEPGGRVPSIPFWKRGLDVTLTLLAAPVWLPVMGVIAALIKVVDPGPVFYKQERIGYGGKPFMCLKFRSMRQNAETRSHEGYFQNLMKSEQPMTKLDTKGDARLIPFGRVLRASGLDELAQLFNVLRGEMSLVGPRPCTVKEFFHYEPHQRLRANALPGLTGFWQVNGKNKTTFARMIELDVYYINHQSVWLDLWIILMTFPTLLSQCLETKGHTE